MTSGEFNTLPLELFAMTTNVTSPVLYALGTLTTIISFSLIIFTIIVIKLINKKVK
jgi:putative spermidine/putrescine transport system permease protein